MLELEANVVLSSSTFSVFTELTWSVIVELFSFQLFPLLVLISLTCMGRVLAGVLCHSLRVPNKRNTVQHLFKNCLCIWLDYIENSIFFELL